MVDHKSKDQRPCTCHPDDRPPVCQHRYGARECQDAYRASLEMRTSKDVVQQLRDWYEEEWINGNRLTHERAMLLWSAIRALVPDETPQPTSNQRPTLLQMAETALGQWLHDFGNTNELSQRSRIILDLIRQDETPQLASNQD